MFELSLIVIFILTIINAVLVGFYEKARNRISELERMESGVNSIQYMPQVKPPRKESKDVEIANLRSILKMLVRLDDNDVYTSEPWIKALDAARLVLNQEGRV